MAESGKKLSEEEISEALKSFNVPFKKNELSSPTREFMVRIFECFLKDLQIDVGSNEFRTWAATGHIEDGDIYEEAQMLLLLAMIVNHITYPLNLNITIKDILEPKPKRTKKILNYIVVFWNYYIQKCIRFHKVQEFYEDDRKKAEDLISENKSLEEKYNEKFHMLQNMQPSKEELKNCVLAKEEKINKFEQQKEELSAQYASLKTKVANVENQISNTEVSIVTAKERLEELSQLILSSPQRLNLEILRLRDGIKSEDKKIKEKEAKLKDTEKQLQQQEDSLKDDEKALSVLNNITEDVNNLGDFVKSIVANHQKLDEEDDKLKKLLGNLEQKEIWEAHQKQKSLKVAINTKKQTETYMTLRETYTKDEAKERNMLELVKRAVDELQEKVESESNSIKEIYEKSKEANDKSKERRAQHIMRVEEAVKNFKSECESVVQKTKEKFPNISM